MTTVSSPMTVIPCGPMPFVFVGPVAGVFAIDGSPSAIRY